MSDETTASVTAESLAAVIEKAEAAGAEAIASQNFEGAKEVYAELLSLQPGNPAALCGLGAIAIHVGDLANAELLFRKAAESAPMLPAGPRCLAGLYLDQGRLPKARRMVEKARALAPNDPELAFLEATVHQKAGQPAAQEKALAATLALDPDHLQALVSMGVLAISKGKVEDALAFFERAAQNPDATGPVHINKANALIALGRVEDAKSGLITYLEAVPDDAKALYSLAMAERRLNELEDAHLHVEKALALGLETADAENLAGTIAKEQARYEEAKSHFAAALDINPDHASSRSNMGLLKILLGEWTEGLAAYEARLDDPNFAQIWGRPPIPKMTGTVPDGKTVVVFSEQGFGDSIQFARYLPQLAAQGGNVIFAVQPELKRLMEGLDERVRVVGPEDHLSGIDLQANLMSLPYLLDAEAPGPGGAYLEAPSPSSEITALLDGLSGLKVGIASAGSKKHMEDRKRSIPADTLSPLAEIKGVSYVDLNVTAETPVFKNAVPAKSVVSDFADAAALVAQLDLVVTVDTAAAHLAGALGIPCFVMLPHVPDWRWGLASDTTPWYETISLYRQPSIGAWAPVIEAVAKDVAARV